jgi:hypothetical protein
MTSPAYPPPVISDEHPVAPRKHEPGPGKRRRDQSPTGAGEKLCRVVSDGAVRVDIIGKKLQHVGTLDADNEREALAEAIRLFEVRPALRSKIAVTNVKD